MAPSPPAPTGNRTAREVIDDAIRENRSWERVCLGLTVGIALIGAGVLLAGAIRDDGLVAIAGAASSGLVWPALRYAGAARRTNIALRMLEIPLGLAKTEVEAAQALKNVYVSLFAKKGQ